jgi:C4-dicarboxylate-specific signal transduction histidine kinase
MLSQRLAKASLALRDADDDAARQRRMHELRQTLEQWTAEHDVLLHGDPQLGISPLHTPDLYALWAQLDPHYRAMVAAAEQISETTSDGRALRDVSPALASLGEHEVQYLPLMDSIVKIVEERAAQEVSLLRMFALGIAAMVVVLLIGLGWMVVWPATQTIRLQVDELELRVAARTRELADALASLHREVSEREMAEQANHRLASQLAHSDRVTTMGHLTAGLAHELNQPLAAIANYTSACEVLLEEPQRDGKLFQAREFMLKAKEASLRAGQIIRRMRNFVRPNAVNEVKVGIHTLIQEIVELCRNNINESEAKLALELKATRESVRVDPIQIQQVLVNLVQNALQAMRESDLAAREIIIRTTSSSELIQVDVLDTGPGFDSTDTEAVFAPYHTSKDDGLGIGLTICRSILENCDGKIWAESRPGRGAQVSFTVPLAADHAERQRSPADCLCC